MARTVADRKIARQNARDALAISALMIAAGVIDQRQRERWLAVLAGTYIWWMSGSPGTGLYYGGTTYAMPGGPEGLYAN